MQLELVDGSTIVGVTLLRGTMTGPMMLPAVVLGVHGRELLDKVPATGRKIGFYTSQVLDLGNGGAIVHESQGSDLATLLRQVKPDAVHHARPVLDKLPMPKVIAIAKHDATETANHALALRWFDAFSRHDRAAYAELLADDLVSMSASAPKDRDKAAEVADADALWKGFPDARLTVEHQWAAGRYVATEARLDATNTGDMPAMHVAKTGRTLVLPMLVIAEIADGKIHRAWRFDQSTGAAMSLCDQGELPCANAAR